MPLSGMPALSSVKFSFRGNTDQANTSAWTPSFRAEIAESPLLKEEKGVCFPVVTRRASVSALVPAAPCQAPVTTLLPPAVRTAYCIASGHLAITNLTRHPSLSLLWHCTHAHLLRQLLLYDTHLGPSLDHRIFVFVGNMDVAVITYQPLFQVVSMN